MAVFIFSIIAILSPVISETNVPQTELIGGSEGCVKQFNKNGSYSLEIKEDCRDVYYVNIGYEINTSIINLTTSIEYIGQDADLIKNSSDIKSTFDIRLYESTKYFDTNKEETILMEKWYENAETIPCVRNYLSRSSKLFIRISGTGNWSHYGIKFYFNEIKYCLIPLDPIDGTQTVAYRPNSVHLLRLYEPQMRWRGIEIWFNNLRINIEMGEYVLIGTGTEPFENKQSRPLYITEVTDNSTFFVDDSSAFVAFVSGPVQKKEEDFKIMWKGIEEKIDIEPEDPMGVLNSSLICFYNYSAAIQEFEKDKSSRFELFRNNFAEIAKAYLPKESDDLNKRLNIDLFGKSTKKNVDGSDVLSILIKVMYKGKSIFTWRQLQSMIEIFEKNSTDILGYKVGKCPQGGKFDLPYKDAWSFVFYALVPVFGLFALTMWAWKHNLFSQNCLTEKGEKLSFGYTPAEPNAYETTIPKVYRCDDDEGRRETLIKGSSQQEDSEGAKDTTMVEMNAIPSNSQDHDTLKRFLSNPRSKSRPSLKSLLNNVEEIKMQSHSSRTEGNESDNLYDSVNSSKGSDETKL